MGGTVWKTPLSGDGLCLTLTISPDNAVVVSKAVEEHISLWDSATGKAIAAIADPVPVGQTPNNGLSQLRFSPDGKYLSSRHYQWNTWQVPNRNLVESINLVKTLNIGFGVRWPLASSPDGRLVVRQEHYDLPRLGIWDVKQGTLLRMLEPGKGAYERFQVPVFRPMQNMWQLAETTGS